MDGSYGGAFKYVQLSSQHMHKKLVKQSKETISSFFSPSLSSVGIHFIILLLLLSHYSNQVTRMYQVEFIDTFLVKYIVVRNLKSNQGNFFQFFNQQSDPNVKRWQRCGLVVFTNWPKHEVVKRVHRRLIIIMRRLNNANN